MWLGTFGIWSNLFGAPDVFAGIARGTMETWLPPLAKERWDPEKTMAFEKAWYAK